MIRPSSARRSLRTFFVALVVGTALVQGALLSGGRSVDRNPVLVFTLMWIPALASFVARAVHGEGIRDVSFRLGGRRGLASTAFAWGLPLLVCAVAYGVAWGSELEPFGAPHGPSDPLVVAFGKVLFSMATYVLPLGCLSAAGEEIGWRGFMLTRLIDARVPKPVLVSGLVWAVWHEPLLLSGQLVRGPSPWLVAAMFVPCVVACAYVSAWLRLRSGSVWPPIVLHAMWNDVADGAFDAFTRASSEPQGQLWTGSAGIIVALTWAAVATVMWRRWPLSLPLAPAAAAGA
ncbi:CAAX amino terminal protease family protein [Labilithrix luteola]|uniref:CAAX amino terminal protease family protein n=1 Tax=Labilithrix luteola TaxID=1391654 RepID=A0A0K1PIV2_9BACT|nr:type II CAAX endopeptidase family protein [Labilithrix luteola]AKU93450.1 CAAX amino terminal protease family protein [Labilithrix luteola]